MVTSHPVGSTASKVHFSKTLPPEPSTHSMITPKNVPLTPCKDINFHRAFTQPPFDRRSSPVQSIGGPLLRACSEKETSSISRLPVNGRRQHRRLSHSESSISRYTLEYTESPHAKDAVPPQGSFPFTHFSTPNFDEATNDPQADDDTVSQKSLWLERETPGGHSHTDNPCMSDIRPTEPSSGENTTPLEKSSPCISAGMIEPKEIQSPPPPTTRAKSNAKGKGKRPGKGSSASKQLQKSSNEGCRRFPPAIDTRYQRTLGKKRFAQAMDVAAKLARLVCQGGTKCVEGGPEFIVQTFQGRDNDLSLLKPDRAALTLEDLGPQQRIYATSLLQTSTIADIVHSWCIIAYEYQLSTRYRDAMTRRDQPKVRSSLRVRSRGIIVAEAHRLLAEAIGADAYKLCPAILAGISAQEPFPCLRVCRDWSTDQLKLIAGVWVNHLLNSEERSWMQIDQEYAIDPAAQIVAKDFL